MNNRLFFILNPVAGNGRAIKLWPEIAAGLKAKGISFDFAKTGHKGHAMAIAKEVAHKGYKCFISVGGDGTFHEMINGLMSANLARPPRVFILPVGTGNDFVREHRIPQWGAAWLQMLLNFQTKSHNVGQLDYYSGTQKLNRYFVNVAGLFYDGYIVRATTVQKKSVSSSFQYLLLILKYLFRYRPPTGRIRWPEGELHGAFYTANIGICRYSGGGMRFVPHAHPFGKQFAVTVARKMHPIRVLLSTPYFYNGKVAQHAKISCFKTNQLSIEPLGDEEILVEADGEFLGQAPCTFSLIRDGFLLVSS